MKVYLTEEFSRDISNKFDFVSDCGEQLKSFFARRDYGPDLKVVTIGLFCMSPQFENFFKQRKPKYTAQAKDTIEKGIVVPLDEKSLEYELRIDYKTYSTANNIREPLAKDVLNSLEVIKTIKKIKDFSYDVFRRDIEAFFWQVGWLS